MQNGILRPIRKNQVKFPVVGLSPAARRGAKKRRTSGGAELSSGVGAALHASGATTMAILRASLVCSVLVCIANASAGRIVRFARRVPNFEPRIDSEPRSLGLRGGTTRANLALRGGGKPVNDKDAAHLMGKTIVFVSAGYEAKKAIVDIAHARGVNIIVIDEPTSWASPTNPDTLDKEGKVHKCPKP